MGLYTRCLRAGVGMVMGCGTIGREGGRDPAPTSTIEHEGHTHEVESQPQGPAVSNAETIAYQRRELGKELVLLERHLLQRCKINGKGCGCCEKHPMSVEGLAEETLGMTGDPVYADLRNWMREIAPKTTAAASQSGRYDEEYIQMAVRARAFRKAILESEDIMAVFSPTTRAATAATSARRSHRAPPDPPHRRQPRAGKASSAAPPHAGDAGADPPARAGGVALSRLPARYVGRGVSGDACTGGGA